MKNYLSQIIFYLDLKHVHNYGSTKFQPNLLGVFFTTNGHRKCGGRNKEKNKKKKNKKNRTKEKVGKSIGDPVGGWVAPIITIWLNIPSTSTWNKSPYRENVV